MKRDITWIISDNAAGVDDYSIGLRSFPMLSPPANVILSRIDFGNVGLTPPSDATIPRRFASFRVFASRLTGTDRKTSLMGKSRRCDASGFQEGAPIHRFVGIERGINGLRGLANSEPDHFHFR